MKLRIILVIIFIISLGWLISSRSEIIKEKISDNSYSIDETIKNTKNKRYKDHLIKLKPKIPGTDFSVVVSKPFVVIGNDRSIVVQLFALKLVREVVISLKKKYFKKDPAQIIDIWLFKDSKSYEYYTKKIFRMNTGTPFGFYSSTHHAMIMNIATGGGTLIHEICHPFTDANFPECPPWLFEGLGSLYEQSEFVDGEIRGKTNWRLENVQILIDEGGLPSFQKLFAMDDETFYDKDTADNYGQSRYLCYYLQEKGFLKKYFHEFVKNCKEDPTGIDTLIKVCDIKNMDTFTKEWEDFVLKLQFP